MINVKDIVEDNGYTVEQNNLNRKHNIPLGSLVEVTDDDPESEHIGLRLYVVRHSRDCDGTPLYDLSFKKRAAEIEVELHNDMKNSDPESFDFKVNRAFWNRAQGSIDRGYPESSLTVIK